MSDTAAGNIDDWLEALMRAIEDGEPDVVRTLLDSSDCDLDRNYEPWSSSPLGLAVDIAGIAGSERGVERDDTVVRLLLEHGASASFRDASGQTPADTATLYGWWSLACELWQLEQAAAARSGERPSAERQLMHAIVARDVEAVRSLARDVGDLDFVSPPVQIGPLHLAVRRALDEGDYRDPDDEIVQVLLDLGASAKFRLGSGDGWTAADTAESGGRLALAGTLRSRAFDEVDRFADLRRLMDHISENDRTAIERAVASGIELDVTVEAYGASPLQYAIELAAERASSRPAATPDDGIARLLLDLGASAHYRDRRGRTAVDVAEAVGWTSLAAELRRHGPVS